jgi:hypothetical protein
MSSCSVVQNFIAIRNYVSFTFHVLCLNQDGQKKIICHTDIVSYDCVTGNIWYILLSVLSKVWYLLKLTFTCTLQLVKPDIIVRSSHDWDICIAECNSRSWAASLPISTRSSCLSWLTRGVRRGGPEEPCTQNKEHLVRYQAHGYYNFHILSFLNYILDEK